MKRKGFTLVELIIVISIIAFLAVSATMVLTKFITSSRDTRRISDVATIKKGLDIYYTENYNVYPMPDSDPTLGISTGVVNGSEVNYKGSIWDTASKALSLQRTPKDPSNNNQGYVYAVTSDRKYYQISYVLEDGNRLTYGGDGETGLITSLPIASVSAAGEKARVEGNYRGLISLLTGGQYYIVNAPSLIYANTGVVNLDSTSTYFVVDKNDNLPYVVGGGSLISAQKEDGNTVMKEVTSNSSAILTAVNITAYYTNGTPISSLITGTNLSGFGGTTILNIATQVVGGGSAGVTTSPTTNNCSSTTYSGYTITALNHGVTQSFNKSSAISNGNLVTTISATCNNGTLSYGSESTLPSCNSGYVPQSNSCVADVCGNTVPANATSNATGQSISLNWTYNATPGMCTFACNTNYTWNGSACNANTQSVSCSGSPSNTVYFNNTSSYTITQTWNGSTWTPTTVASYAATPTTNTCQFKCGTNYTWNGSNACNASTQSVSCGGSIPANATASTATTYTQTWNGSAWTPTTSRTISGATCGYTCNSGYSWNGSSCVANPSCTSAHGYITYTSNGTFVPGPNCSTVRVLVVGGGGYGGCDRGGGGGGGWVVRGSYGVGSAVSVVVGGQSGTSSFGAYLSATGGSGGHDNGSDCYGGNGGTGGGTGSGCGINDGGSDGGTAGGNGAGPRPGIGGHFDISGFSQSSISAGGGGAHANGGGGGGGGVLINGAGPSGGNAGNSSGRGGVGYGAGGGGYGGGWCGSAGSGAPGVVYIER